MTISNQIVIAASLEGEGWGRMKEGKRRSKKERKKKKRFAGNNGNICHFDRQS
jgi:hypothetical protein